MSWYPGRGANRTDVSRTISGSTIDCRKSLWNRCRKCSQGCPRRRRTGSTAKPKRPKPTKPGDVAPPMPGRVVKVLVTEGSTVTAGDPLLIIEAMKMESRVPAPMDGRVDSDPRHGRRQREDRRDPDSIGVIGECAGGVRANSACRDAPMRLLSHALRGDVHERMLIILAKSLPGSTPFNVCRSVPLSVHGQRLAYLDQGQGPPVILLHGFGGSMWQWEYQQGSLVGPPPSRHAGPPRVRPVG